MNGLLLALAFVMGVVVPLQAAINHQLKLLIGGSTVGWAKPAKPNVHREKLGRMLQQLCGQRYFRLAL